MMALAGLSLRRGQIGKWHGRPRPAPGFESEQEGRFPSDPNPAIGDRVICRLKANRSEVESFQEMSAEATSAARAAKRMRMNGWRLLASGPVGAALFTLAPRYQHVRAWGYLLVAVFLAYWGVQWLSLRRIAKQGWADTRFTIQASQIPIRLVAEDGTVLTIGNYAYLGPSLWSKNLSDGADTGALARRGARFAVFLDSRPDRIVIGRLPAPPTQP